MLLARANIRERFTVTLAPTTVDRILYSLDVKQFGVGAVIQAAMSFFGANPGGTLSGMGSEIQTGQLNVGGTDWSGAENSAVYGNAVQGANPVAAEWETKANGILEIEADNPDGAAQIITVDLSIAVIRLGDFS